MGFSASVYLLGEVIGALCFGRLADQLGRRKLFVVTLALYLIANGLTALSFSSGYFLLTRFFAGAGIGGEYDDHCHLLRRGGIARGEWLALSSSSAYGHHADDLVVHHLLHRLGSRTVSEIFPLQMRAQAIALFFAMAQLFGGVVAPALFAVLIASHSRDKLAYGYQTGALVMILGSVVTLWLGVDAEGKSLEQAAPPPGAARSENGKDHASPPVQ